MATTAGQPPTSATAPPSRGPSEDTVADAPATRPRAALRAVPENRAEISAVASTGTAPAPAPCSARPASSIGSDGAATASAAPTAITAMPTMSGRRMPTTSATRP